MKNVTTLTAKLPTEIHQKILERIIHDKYGMRGKSKWINEALEIFLGLPDFHEFVEIGEEMEQIEMNGIISIRIPNTLYHKLEDAVIQVRKQHPGMEGVKSKIIRASLLQRLIRN
jgi:hypothetical protein